MSSLMTASIALSALNLLLALAVLWVHGRNHGQIRSPFTLALLAFSLFLVLHNALQVYNLATMMAIYTDQAATLLLVENGLQLGALGMLVWATLR